MLTYDFSRYDERSGGTVNPLRVGLNSWHSSALHTEPHLSPFETVSHFALPPPSRLYAHISRATITFDVDGDLINPQSTHFVSGSASVLELEHTPQTDPLPATGCVACDGF